MPAAVSKPIVKGITFSAGRTHLNQSSAVLSTRKRSKNVYHFFAQGNISIHTGYVTLHMHANVLALGEEADFEAQNFQYTTKVDAR
jgi:hypothetical protein